MAALAANIAAHAAFDAILERIGFPQQQRDAIIETTGCSMLQCLASLQQTKLARCVNDWKAIQITQS
jgi:hypothetical protein